MFKTLHVWIITCLITLAGCAVTPDTITKQAEDTRPKVTPTQHKTAGAIYGNNGYRPLFEDRRPRYVGDIVTVNIVENTTATKAAGSSASKDSSADSSITALLGSALPEATVGANSSLSYDDASAANASNNFTGDITATVSAVLPNGYLVISGEKQVSFDKSTEFVRFSGVVNPDTISIGNMVSSTRIADARVEYRTNSKIDKAEIVSMFARFFLSMGL